MAMMRSAMVLALLTASASAFVVPAPARSRVAVRMQDEPDEPKAPGGSLVVSNRVRELLRENDLKDPSTFNEVETNNFIAGVGAGALGVFLLPLFEVGFLGDAMLSALVGGGALAYTQLRRDALGDGASKVGSLSMQAVEKGKELNEKYDVADTFTKKADELAKDVQKKLKEL